MMETCNRIGRACYKPSVGYLLIRLVVGAIFIHHGWMKFGSEDMTMGFMQSLGLPGAMAYFITAVELLGGAMLILGVLTRVAALILGIEMLVAVLLVAYPHGGLAHSEFELLLAAASFSIAFIGAGKYRLSNLFEHEQ